MAMCFRQNYALTDGFGVVRCRVYGEVFPYNKLVVPDKLRKVKLETLMSLEDIVFLPKALLNPFHLGSENVLVFFPVA